MYKESLEKDELCKGVHSFAVTRYNYFCNISIHIYQGYDIELKLDIIVMGTSQEPHYCHFVSWSLQSECRSRTQIST